MEEELTDNEPAYTADGVLIREGMTVYYRSGSGSLLPTSKVVTRATPDDEGTVELEGIWPHYNYTLWADPVRYLQAERAFCAAVLTRLDTEVAQAERRKHTPARCASCGYSLMSGSPGGHRQCLTCGEPDPSNPKEAK